MEVLPPNIKTAIRLENITEYREVVGKSHFNARLFARKCTL